MLLRYLSTTAFVAVASAVAPPITDCTNTTVGPENGHLVIVGGNLQSDDIWKKIIELAGGPDASIVVIPTAGGEPSYNESFASAVTLRSLGANKDEKYDLKARKVIDTRTATIIGNGRLEF